jgi:hypothetical protein
MSKLVRFFAIAALLAGAFAMTPAPAVAQHHGHWHGGHYYHGGGWGWGPGPFWGWGAPYAYYGGPACGWHYVRVWRGRWVLRRAWRCY